MQGTGNEKQTVTLTGDPDGGDFTLTWGGQTTAAIAFNANAATVQARLEALSNIGVGDVVCTLGPLPAAVQVEFAGALKNTNVAAMTANAAGLTGGTAPAVVIATTFAGNPALTEAANWDDPAAGVNSREGFPGDVPPAGSTLVDDDGV